jgi:hypothetical protein
MWCDKSYGESVDIVPSPREVCCSTFTAHVVCKALLSLSVIDNGLQFC